MRRPVRWSRGKVVSAEAGRGRPETEEVIYLRRIWGVEDGVNFLDVGNESRSQRQLPGSNLG